MTESRADRSLATLLPSTGNRDDPGGGARFRVVGIGGSAGALAAFTQFLQELPTDTGMAFVLVPHLSPSKPSALAEILSRATGMPVMEVRHGQAVEPNRVYIIPPGRSMIVAGRVLQLQPRSAGAMHRPIDHFLCSLAEDLRELAVGVVLSGTATDGTLGLEAIKGERGMTFAQDASAQHDGMPHSAVASGCVDLVLAPAEMAREIGRLPAVPPKAGAPGVVDKPNLAPVLQVVRDATGADFSQYQLNTLYRRVSRRMAFRKLDSLADYLECLRQTPAEVAALYQDLLIRVTSFFRDEESFEALARQVFPHLLANRTRHEPVRFWTTGCSTGQEAYSLAIAFTEAIESADSPVTFQLFATDLNPTCIEKARAGVYPNDIVQDVSPERLQRFFTRGEGHFQIDRRIRKACVFSQHNLATDPPFSRMDLISCRNLLIYFEPDLQRRIVPILHYALEPAGYLWLGRSESLRGHSDLFEVQDHEHRIYAKRAGSSPGRGRGSRRARNSPRAPLLPVTAPPSHVAELLGEADRILLDRFAPPGVVVSVDLDILQFRGDTGPYLTPAPGKASLSLVRMLREGLLAGVRAAIIRAGEEAVPAREGGMRVETNGDDREVAVEVIPIRGHGGDEGAFLVLFEAADVVREPEAPGDAGRSEAPAGAFVQSASDLESARLARELAATRRYMQLLLEQQEATNEELQSANAEVNSANEELQSTNEELETTKEEVQASNEELQHRNAELNRVNNDLSNVMRSMQTAVVTLGPDLRVKRFTHTASTLLNLTQADVGRPMADIAHTLNQIDLTALMEEVIQTFGGVEREAQDSHGRWYSLRMRPYQSPDGRLDGVVVMLIDVDAIKRAQAHTEGIVATVREPLLVLDKELRVRTASRSFYDEFKVAPSGTENRLFFELGNGQWDSPELRRLLEGILIRGDQVIDYAVEHKFEHIGTRTMLLNARRLIQTFDEDPLILLAIGDITERSLLARSLEEQRVALLDRDRRKDSFLAMLSHELRTPLAPIANAVYLLGLHRDGENPVQKQARGILERQVVQLRRLVDDLLDISRISSGKIQLRRKRVALSGLVEAALDSVGPLIDQRRHELSVSLPSEPIWLHGDATRLDQVLANLLTNAAKFTGEGGHIWLTVRRDGEQCVLRVRDSGVGIPPDLLPQVFDLFTQADRSSDRSEGGLGIGLALVRQLTDLHGGTVEAHSTVGHGSEFVVHLPIAPTDAAPPLPKEDFQPAARSLRVLVVDDNVDTAASFSMLLNALGHEVRIAHDGPTALNDAGEYRPDVALLDIGLPGMDGYEVAERLRRQTELQPVLLVALTGYGSPMDHTRSQEAGFDHHLVKPVDLGELTRVLASVDAR